MGLTQPALFTQACIQVLDSDLYSMGDGDEYSAGIRLCGRARHGLDRLRRSHARSRGTLGFIDGLVAVSKSSFYVAGAHYVFSDLHTWGWIVMIVGVITVLAGFGVLTGSQWARWFGVAIASLQAIAQLLMIQAYPFWSLCVFAIDLLVIYGLMAHGGKLRKA